MPRRKRSCVNFRKGDPYIKVDQGYARLPGAGYEALHPELKGVNPENYPDLAKLRILADVAPYSREYQRVASQVRHRAQDNPEMLAEYQQIAEQVRQRMEMTTSLPPAAQHMPSRGRGGRSAVPVFPGPRTGNPAGTGDVPAGGAG